MAIVALGLSKCSLCDAVIATSADIVAFPHFIGDETHPLWRFSDSAMHCACFALWDQAEQFRRIYNEAFSARMPRPREMRSDGTIVDLKADPAP